MQPVICEIIITFSAETKKTKRKLIVPLLIFLFPVRKYIVKIRGKLGK